MQPWRIVVIAAIAVLIVCAPALADSSQPDEDELASDVNDPVARLTQIPIKEQFTPSQYGTNAAPNTIKFQPVFDISPHYFFPLEQLARPTFQVVTVPRNKTSETTTAFDDFQLLDLVIVPFPDSRKTHFRWGIGPYFIFPTSTTSFSGNGSWQAGPAWAFSWQLDRFKFSWLFQQSTSFAYTSGHSKSVASIQIQPLLSYALNHGWYLKSSDANWKVSFRHKSGTTIPISGGIGKVFELSHGYAVNAAVSGEWMAYRQFASQTEQFTMILQLSIVLPQTGL